MPLPMLLRLQARSFLPAVLMAVVMAMSASSLAPASTPPAPLQAGDEQPTDWQRVSPDGSRMAIEMPGTPQLSAPIIRPTPDKPEKEVKVHLAMVTQNEGKTLFLVGYHDLDSTPQEEQKINDVLEGGVKGTVLNTLGQLTKHERIKIDTHPGRGFEYAGNRFGQQIRGISRIYLVGARVYQLTVLYTPEVDVTASAEKFFDSFQLLPESKTESAPKPAKRP